MPTKTAPTSADVRAWAIKKRAAKQLGRLSNATVAAYNKAHPKNPYVA